LLPQVRIAPVQAIRNELVKGSRLRHFRILLRLPEFGSNPGVEIMV
jgi:hypothetical protein